MITGGLLEAVLLQIVIPEVASWLRKEPDLTDEQIIARYQERRDRIIAQGRRFLAETDPTVERARRVLAEEGET